jgi:DNA-binding MarR family transcriptional regulator
LPVPKQPSKAAPRIYRELALGYDLRDTSRVLLRALQVLIAPHDVTLNQFFLLRQLWGKDGVSQREISERMQTSDPATVAAIDGLEKRGYVKRVRESRDRRIVSIFVTPKGEALRDTLLGYAADINDHGVSGMSRAEVATLHALLLRFKENLESYEIKRAAAEAD